MTVSFGVGSARRKKIENRDWRRRKMKAVQEPAEPDKLGWKIPGGGMSSGVPQTPEFRGPTVQVCGLYPFGVGSSLALIGAPLGPHLEPGRGMVCGDPVSYFVHQLINNPSAFLIARAGVGKSTLIRHIAAFLVCKGILPIVLSDWRPDYVNLVRALKGQVITVNRTSRFLNPLDPGPLWKRLDELPERVRAAVVANAKQRRVDVMKGLCGLALRRELEAHEANVLSKAIEVWDSENPGRVPVVHDILTLVQNRHQALRMVVRDRGDEDRYDERTEHLADALTSLDGGAETFGRVFAEPTSEELELDRAVVFDLSELEGMDAALQAGVQMVCWSYGSTAVSGAKALADAGLGARRTYLLIMDELWRALSAAEFMVDRINEIVKLNRALGLAQILCSHSMEDLRLHSEAATAKAWGFVRLSEIVYLGGLTPSEMGNLQQVFDMSEEEKNLLTDWAQSGEMNPDTGDKAPPRGRGKFLLKIGKKPGIPFRVELTPIELESGIHETSAGWNDQIAAMSGAAMPGQV